MSQQNNTLPAGERVEGFFYHKLFRTLKFIEDVILIISITVHLLMLRVKPEYGSFDPSADPASVDYFFNRWTTVAFILVVYFAVTRISLIDRTIAQKVSVLCVCGILCALAYVVGISAYILPLFAVIVARSVLVLEQVNIWWICSTSYLAILAAVLGRNWMWEPAWRNESFDAGVALVLFNGAILLSFRSLIIVVLVAFLVRALVSAKKQMIETERLSDELAAMAASVERSRIAQDLHDSVGHALTSLSMQLEVAKKLFQKNPQRASEALTQAESLAKKSLRDVRSAVAVMKIENFDLEGAVIAMLEDIESTDSISIESTLDIPSVHPTTGYELFRVIQESCTNVLRYAEAEKLIVSISSSGGKLEISIQDNGKGFNSDGVSKGTGIEGMKERIDRVGGTLIIDSTKHGTTVSVMVPLESDK